MERESKKRKMENEEEDEEEKMNKFFALLRSTREMRDRMMGRVGKSPEAKGKKGEGEKPSFQPEDFMEGANHYHQSKGTQPNPLPGSSKREDEAKQEDKREGSGNDGLDLKLSL